MSPSSANIHGFLRRCRRRLLGMEITAGIVTLTSLILAAVQFMLLGLALFQESAWVPRGLLLALTTGLILTVLRYAVFPWFKWHNASALAREMEKRMQSSQLELVSAVQLEARLPEINEIRDVSPQLVHAHLDRVSAEISEKEPKQLIRLIRLRRPFVGFGIIAASALICAILVPGLFFQAMASLLGPAGTTVSTAARDTSSWVGDIRLAYTYPAYTGRGERVVEGSDGTILALPGTQVAITSRADRPIERAKLKLDQRTLPLSVSDGKHLSGELTVMQAGSYRFELHDLAGKVWTEHRVHPIHLEADRAPRVTLRKPDRDLVVRERDKVDLLYDARDDFGLEQVRIAYRTASRVGEVKHKVLTKFTAGSRRINKRAYRWDLATLGLEPGDVVQFTIEALDNDTVLGPKAGRSATRSLKVFSADEHHRELLERAQALWEKLLNLLADTLEHEPGAKAGSSGEKEPARPKSYRNIHKDTASFLSEMSDLIQAMSKDELARTPLVDALVNVNRGMGRLQSELNQLLRMRKQSKKRYAEYFARAIPGHRKRRIQRMERDVLYLEDLLDLMRLEDLDRITRELNQTRQRLAELMRKYQKAPSDEVRSRIEAEIAKLKEKVAKLLARQREVLKSLRDEYLNPEALSKMLSDNDMMAALDRIQKLMMQGKVDEAMRELERLERQLQALQNAIDQSRAGYGQGKYSELAQELAKIQAELNMITESQRQLTERTGVLRDRVVSKLNKLDRKKMKSLFKQLRARLKKAVDLIASIPDKDLDMYTRKSRGEVLERAKMLDKALKIADVDSSLQMAEILESVASRFERSMEAMALAEKRYHRSRDKRVFGNHRKSKKAHAEFEAIYQELLKMMPRPDQLLGKGDLKRLSKLGQLQAELKGKLSQLKAQMQKINKSVPLFGGGAMGRMDRGGNHMGRASSKLGQKRPRGAHPHQQAALSELESLQEALEKSCKGGTGIPLPMGASRMGMGRGTDQGGPGRDINRNDVEIPGPEEYQPPEAFRKALLEGMKDAVPEDFEQLVKRYYEELVK